MPFRPQVDDAILIDGSQYRFTPHPVAKDMPYGQSGRRATVYQVEANGSILLALKVFTQSFRLPGIAESASHIRPYAGIPGLQVCARLVITPEKFETLLARHPDLKYACLIPWVIGATWQEVMLENRPLTEEQSLNLGFSLVRILATMEQKGLAHCDLSGPNIILPGLDNPITKAPVALVDVEEMFSTNLPRPEKLSAGSPGYAHKAAARGIWNIHADRFAGAVILAEMLCWCDEDFRNHVYGEQFFDPIEIHKDSERYQIMMGVLQKLWGEEAGQLFDRTWHSETLEECPKFLEWGRAIFAIQQRTQPETFVLSGDFEDEIDAPLTGYQAVELPDVEEKDSSRKVAESMLVEAGKLESQGRVQDAMNLYRGAIALLAEDDPLSDEIDLIITNLSDQISEPKAQTVQPDVGKVEVREEQEKPSKAMYRRRINFVPLLIVGGIIITLLALFIFGNDIFKALPILAVPTFTLKSSTVTTTPTFTVTHSTYESTATSSVFTPGLASTPLASPHTEISLSPTPIETPTLKAVSTQSTMGAIKPPSDSAAQLIYIKDNGKSLSLYQSLPDGKSGRDLGDVSPLYSVPKPAIQLSPDQGKIAYVVPKGNTFSLFIVTRETGESREATLPGAVQEAMLWSPDGKFIAFENNETAYDVEQNKKITYGQRVDNIAWSPAGSKLAGKIGAYTLAVYDAGDNQPRIIDGNFLNWIDEENLLVLSLDQDQTMLTVEKVNVEADSIQQLYRGGIASSCVKCATQLEWLVSISPSKNKAVLYRKRPPYYDILWLDFSNEEAKYFYQGGLILLWAGWTNDSQGIFLASQNANIPAGFPETVMKLSNLVADGGNALGYAVSPTGQQTAVLLCQDNTSPTATCDILLIDEEGQGKILTKEPQKIYWQNGIVWSPGNSMLAYVVEKDNLPSIAVMQIEDQSELIVSQTIKLTSLFWIVKNNNP